MTDPAGGPSEGRATAADRRSAAAQQRSRYELLVQSLLVVAVAVVLLWPRARERDFWWSDASRHGLDGVFVTDFVRDHGFLDPYAYTVRYAARYPALGVAYYPPLFAVVEAAVYCVAGSGYGAARATVVLFGVVAGLGCYALGRRVRGGWFGLVAALAFLTMHDVVYWSRDVMLEMPAAAMGVLAMFLCYLWVEERRRWAVIACAGCLAAALLTKQTAAFLFAVPPAYAVARGRWRLLLDWRALVALGLCVGVAAAYGAFLLFAYRHTLLLALQGKGIAGAQRSWGLARLVFVPARLPAVASVGSVCLAGIGVLLGLWRRRWRELALVGLWFAMGYAFATYACPGRTRFIFNVLPCVALAAALGLWELVPARVRGVPGRAILGVAFVLYQGWVGWGVDVPWVSGGYERAAGIVVEAPLGETVLFHGYHAGNFAYHVRRKDHRRRAIMLRSDKLFGRVHRLKGRAEQFEPTVASAAEVQATLEAHGVGYVVLEPGNGTAASPVRPLLEVAVGQSPWSLRARVPVSSHRAKPGNGEILVYENPRAGRAKAETIPFWVPLSKRTYRVTYAELRQQHGEARKP